MRSGASIKSRPAIFARAAFALDRFFLLAAGVGASAPIFSGTPRNARPSFHRHDTSSDCRFSQNYHSCSGIWKVFAGARRRTGDAVAQDTRLQSYAHRVGRQPNIPVIHRIVAFAHTPLRRSKARGPRQMDFENVICKAAIFESACRKSLKVYRLKRSARRPLQFQQRTSGGGWSTRRAMAAT